MAFAFTSGNPDNLVGGQPAAMIDIRGPFYDIRNYLNTSIPTPPPAPVNALSNITVGEVGQSGQVRAGRQLALADFTALGLSAPAGLWNLSDLTDASGNGRTLTNKGSVPFGVGINGTASTSAVFSGSTGQALYIADTGAADPFRIKTGSWGCWFRTAKRGVEQALITKYKTGANNPSYFLAVGTANAMTLIVSPDGSATPSVTGSTDVADDRWHFVVATFDGTRARIYIDGALDGSVAIAGTIFASATPLNIGAYAADGSIAAVSPHYGRVDEAFVTADVLSEDQIRGLYAARATHTLGAVPGDVRVLVRRRRRGGTLATTDFPTTPVRLHNFTAGSLADEGSGGVALTNGFTTLILAVAGADGAPGNGMTFSGAHTGLSATDAGLPTSTAARSYGCWLKTTSAASMSVVTWGGTTMGGNDARVGVSAGGVFSTNAADTIGPVGSAGDGNWHHVVVTEDNAAGDGVRRKLYLDGRLVGGSTVLGNITLGGATRFRVGAAVDGQQPFTGQLDGAFVHSAALTGEQVRALYSKGTQQLAPSPKDAADHVEAVTSTDVLAVFDSIEASDAVDLIVSP